MRLDSGINVPDDSYVRLIDLGSDTDLLIYEDGTKKFRHICQCDLCGTKEKHKSFNLTWGMDEEIVSLDPFVVEKAMGCQVCGLDGYIRNGKWYDRTDAGKKLEDYDE